MIAQHDKDSKTSGDCTQHTGRQWKQGPESNQPYLESLINAAPPMETMTINNKEDGSLLQEEQESYADSSHCAICLNACEDRTVLATCNRKEHYTGERWKNMQLPGESEN